jgi:hypothetical protein
MHPAENAPLTSAAIAQPHLPLGPRILVLKRCLALFGPPCRQAKDGRQLGQHPGQHRAPRV